MKKAVLFMIFNRPDPTSKVFEAIREAMPESVEKETYCAVLSKKFENDSQIKNELNTISMSEFFKVIKDKVNEYYEGC